MTRILVVEDSPTFMALMTAPLKQKGYFVVEAMDGERALEVAESQPLDLVVLDVILPNKNGFQVCRQLKTSPQTREIKVLMLTSKTQDCDRYWGLKQGADDYMTKPFEEAEYLDRVASLLSAEHRG